MTKPAWWGAAKGSNLFSEIDHHRVLLTLRTLGFSPRNVRMTGEDVKEKLNLPGDWIYVGYFEEGETELYIAFGVLPGFVEGDPYLFEIDPTWRNWQGREVHQDRCSGGHGLGLVPYNVAVRVAGSW